MQRKRLLVVMSFSFSVRYLYRTGMLHKLRAFAEPVIVLTWPQQDLAEELMSDGFEVHIINESSKTKAYENIRAKIDFWFKWFQLKSASKHIQVRYLDQYLSTKKIVIRKLRETYNRLKLVIPSNRKKLFAKEKEMLAAETNFNDMLHLVDELNIDAVFTPAPFQTQEDILLRASKQRGKFMITSILSFDNITKRGWIPVDYNVYMVWNKHNLSELKRIYPAATNTNTHIVGAAQFDFYFNDEYLLTKEEWKKLTGIHNNRKIILYAGGPQALFPNEPQYLKHLDEAITNGTIKDNPVILFRCHPIDDVERWKKYIGASSNIVYDTAWTGKEKFQYTNVTASDIKKLCSTLAYTDVHINLCSTMTVDGSAYNKPQIAPAYDDVPPYKSSLLRNMYYQEHFIPIMNTGGLMLATSKQKLIEYVNSALENPQAYTNQAKNILKEVITYDDGMCTNRVVNVIKETMNNHFKISEAKLERV